MDNRISLSKFADMMPIEWQNWAENLGIMDCWDALVDFFLDHPLMVSGPIWAAPYVLVLIYSGICEVLGSVPAVFDTITICICAILLLIGFVLIVPTFIVCAANDPWSPRVKR